MAQKTASKPKRIFHTYIAHTYSLCGTIRDPDDERLLANCQFFAQQPDEQCLACLKILKSKGYKIEELRQRYRAVHHHAQQLALTA